MTGRLYDIQGFSVHDGPGVRTTVFLKGCPLRCLWCHSPESIPYDYELSQFAAKCCGVESCGECIRACRKGAVTSGAEMKNSDGRTVHNVELDRSKCTGCLECTQVCMPKALAPSGFEMTVDQVAARVMREAMFFGGDGGATISGGEPMLQFEFTLALAKRLHGEGVNICLDTTGYAPWEQYREILPYIDLFLYDIKHTNSEKHRELTGVRNERILENVRLLAENGAKLQIRVPTIPGLNSDMENMRAVAGLCRELGGAVTLVQLLPYHNFGISKYQRLGKEYKLAHIKPPTDGEMEVFLKLMQDHGVPAQIH